MPLVPQLKPSWKAEVSPKEKPALSGLFYVCSAASYRLFFHSAAPAAPYNPMEHKEHSEHDEHIEHTEHRKL